MELISVIVPVYNVEAYLDRCVQSIIEQTYTNLEIILVDDGSPDRCPQMCDAWAKKDPRIKVIHKKNGGLSDARNAGMAVATGSFIGFIDSDDWIEPNMYALLYDRLSEDRSDISACGVEMFWEDRSKESIPLTSPGNHVLNTTAALTALIEESYLKQPVWYKLYKRDLIQNLLFPVGKYHEDVFWSYMAVSRAEKISVFDTPCYHYSQRSGSIMGESYSLRRLDSLEAKQHQLQYMKDHFPPLVPLVHINLLFSCLYSLQMVLRHMSGSEKAEAMHRLTLIFRTHALSLPAGLTAKQRLWLTLAKLSFRGTAALRNALKIGL